MPRGLKKEIYNIAPGGVREDVNPVAIPDGHLLSSLNWLTRRGTGRPRPGYIQVSTQLASADRVTGIGHRGSPLAGDNTVFHTVSKAYFWNGASASDITGTWTTSTADDPVRMTTYVSSGVVYLVRVNALNAVDKWNGTGSFANIAAAPTGWDITTVGSYLVVGRAGGDDYAVQWSAFNDIDTWPAGNMARLIDTPGRIVAVRALTPLSVAIYKEDSVYLGTLQAAKNAFQFQLIAYISGPVSPAAVVPALGAHYWIGENMAIFRFDGAQPQAWTTSLGTTLFQNFSFGNKRQTHGAALDRDSTELWFWYPDIQGTMQRGFSINVIDQSINPHTFTHNITASSDWSKASQLTIDGLDTFTTTIDGLDAVFATIDAMSAPSQSTAVLADSTANFYRFGTHPADNGTAIPWSFEHGYRATGGIAKRAEIDGVLSYWTKAPGSLPITVELTVTDTVGEQDLAVQRSINLTTDSNHQVLFRGLRGKWVKTKHSGLQSLEGLEHIGSAVMCWPRSMV